jgi:single-strand DNA-binding protein
LKASFKPGNGRINLAPSAQTGVERYSTEVVLNGYGGVLTMLDRGPGDQQSGEQSQRNDYAEATGRQQPRAGFAGRESGGAVPLDDDIPFAPEWRG